MNNSGSLHSRIASPENGSLADCPKAIDDPRVVEQIEKYLAALERGEEVNRHGLLERFPAIVEELAACLDGIEFIHRASPRPDRPQSSGAEEGGDQDSDVYMLRELGDYRIVREIGRGGMGVVYEAEQISLGRRVALKILPFAAMLDERQLRRFKNEARAAATLEHPNIVSVHAFGCERAVHFYAMSLVDGQTLAEVINELRQPSRSFEGRHPTSSATMASPSPSPASGQDQAGGHDQTAPSARVSDETPPTPTTVDTQREVQAGLPTELSAQGPAFLRTTTALAVQAAEALDHAHSHGVIHRDIKPGNLMVDTTGKLWITDFGLARLEGDAGMTMSGDIVGTIRYMSPEQALAKRAVVDHRTDIYSLGVTLYSLLTLRPAFDGADRQDVLKQIAFEEPRSLRRVNRAIPRELEVIVLKAMAKNPPERYDTAQDLADDLRRFLDDKPILARPPTISQRAARWSRRHRALVWAGAVILVLTTLGLALSTYFISVERNHTKTALTQAKSNLDLAHQNLERALDAADQMLTRVAERELEMEPRMEHLRRALLEDALRFYETFLREQNDDPRLRAETARASRRVGKLYKTLGQYDSAEQAYRRAIHLSGQLFSFFPEEPSHRCDVLKSYNGLADVLIDLEQLEQAEKIIRQSLVVGGQSASKFPDDAVLKESLANAHDGLACVATITGRFDEAKDALHQACNIFEELDREFPENPAHRFNACLMRRKLGDLMLRVGRMQEAENHYQQCVTFQQQAVDDFPKVPGFKVGLSDTHNSIGDVFLDAGRLSEAEDAYQRAVTIYEQLVGDFPRIHRYRAMLALYLNDLASALLRSGQLSNAEEIQRQSLAIHDQLLVDFPNVPDYLCSGSTAKVNFGHLLMNTGRFQEAEDMYRQALAIQDQLSSQSPEVPVHQHVLANIHIKLATLLDETGRSQEAESIYRKVLTIREQLAGRFPKVPDYRHNLAVSHHDLAVTVMKDLGRAEEAETYLHRASALWQQLHADFPLAMEYAAGIALAQKNLGDLSSKTNRLKKAEVAHRQALDALRQLTADLPDMQPYQQWLAESASALASTLWKTGRPARAEPLLREAIAAFEQLLAESPEAPRHKASIASARCNLGMILSEMDRMEEAEQPVRQALSVFLQLTSEYPDDLSYKAQLGQTHQTLGRLMYTLKRKEEAMHAFREAIVIYEALVAQFPNAAAPRQPLSAAYLDLAVLCTHDLAEAVALATKAVQLQPQDEVCWRTLGEIHYRAGDYETAIEALEQSMSFAEGGNPIQWFLLAMIHYRKGNSNEANKWMNKALHWMSEHKTDDQRLHKYRAAANELMGRCDSALDNGEKPTSEVQEDK